MNEILFHYGKIAPTTWAYLASLLIIGLFFKFAGLERASRSLAADLAGTRIAVGLGGPEVAARCGCGVGRGNQVGPRSDTTEIGGRPHSGGDHADAHRQFPNSPFNTSRFNTSRFSGGRCNGCRQEGG
jgi:hypothetical protein